MSDEPKEGRLVLPKAIRQRFNLTKGTQLEVQAVGDHLELRPVIDAEPVELIERNGRLIVANQDDETFDAVEALRADREERDGHLGTWRENMARYFDTSVLISAFVESERRHQECAELVLNSCSQVADLRYVGWFR